MNEAGQIAPKDEIVAAAQPAAAGVGNVLVQDDFHVVFVGNTAVTSFTDHSTVHFFDHAGFRSRRESMDLVFRRQAAG